MSRNARRDGRLRAAARLVAAWLLAGAVAAPPAAAHDPDPILSGGLYAQNLDLAFRWSASGTPPANMKDAIKDAADDANGSRRSKSPTFDYDAAAGNVVYYGTDVPCGINGLACMRRDPPDWFGVWFRENGHRFDWGTLRWCELSGGPDGCYQVRERDARRAGARARPRSPRQLRRRPRLRRRGRPDLLADEAEVGLERPRLRALRRRDAPAAVRRPQLVDALQHLPGRPDRAVRLGVDLGRPRRVDGDVQRDARDRRHRQAVEQPGRARAPSSSSSG